MESHDMTSVESDTSQHLGKLQLFAPDNDHDHTWVVFSTEVADGWLMLQCVGVVKGPTKKNGQRRSDRRHVPTFGPASRKLSASHRSPATSDTSCEQKRRKNASVTNSAGYWSRVGLNDFPTN